MRLNSFWGFFEEPISTQKVDQVQTAVLMGTKTKTATREEPDQDPPSTGYRTLLAGTLGTKTFTEQKEEPDQDKDCTTYSTLHSS